MKNEANKDYTTDHDETKEYAEPPMYQVVVHNDDFTPMEFVVEILEKLFYLDRRKATEVMYEAHEKGKANCGFYSKDFAESKVSQVVEYARLHEHPLICSMEAV